MRLSFAKLMIDVGFSKTFYKDFIEFRHGLGCYSLAGRDGGRQGIVLASYCAEEHTLIHEVDFINENSNLRVSN